MFSGNLDGEDETTIYSTEEVGVGETGRETVETRGFTVERAAEIIRNLPPEVPRPAALRIVRGTLEAAGINIDDLASSTGAREAKLNSEIELSEGRIQEFKEKTEEVIRSYEAEIRKARDAHDFGISEAENKISASRSRLEDVERVRDFFGLSGDDHVSAEDPGGYSTTTDIPPGEFASGEDTQVMEPADEDDTQILRRPGPLSEDYFDTGETRDR